MYICQKYDTMIYQLKKYKEVFHPEKSERTVRRMIASNLIPSNHIKISKSIINVMSTTEKSELYLEKAIEFNKQKNKKIHDAVAFCIINNLDVQLFVKIVGV